MELLQCEGRQRSAFYRKRKRAVGAEGSETESLWSMGPCFSLGRWRILEVDARDPFTTLNMAYAAKLCG